MITAFKEWFVCNVSQTFVMIEKNAAIVLKAILVSVHFERAVEKGVLMHIVGSTAREVFDRLSAWDYNAHEIGLCSAIEMFLSTYENHQRSLKPYDYMASIIQSRFWFSHARWLTNPRLILYFANRNFNMDSLYNISWGECEKIFSSKNFTRNYNIWIRRLATVVSRKYGRSDLVYHAEAMSLKVVKFAILVRMHLSTEMTMASPALDGVNREGRLLLPLLDRCLRGDYSEAAAMLAQLVVFWHAYQRWCLDDMERMCTRMQHQIYSVSISMSITGRGGAFLGLLKDYTEKYSSITSNEDVAEFYDNSPQMRALRESEASPLWKRVYSMEQIMHELLIDPDFTIHSDMCYQGVTKRYASNLPTSTASESFLPMLVDIQAAAMYACRTGIDGWHVVALFNLDEIRAAVGNPGNQFAVYATRIVEFILSRMVNSQRMNAARIEWACINNRSNVQETMAFVFKCAKELRVQAENVLVQSSRAIPVDQRFRILSNNPMLFIKTGAWIQSELDLLSRHELELVGAGEPFMLLRFHDRALANLIWNDQIDFTTLPEILTMDIIRIYAVRDLIETIDDTPTARYVFCELLTANHAPRSVNYTPPPRMVEAANQLRKIMILCRVVHGEMTMRVTRSFAEDALRALDVPATTTSCWIRSC